MSKPNKRKKDTEIYYNQSGDPMQIRTHDQKLIRRLKRLSEEYPELCKLTEEDEICSSYFDVDKRRITIQVTRPTPRNAAGNRTSGRRKTDCKETAENVENMRIG